MFDKIIEFAKAELGLFTEGVIQLDEEEVIIEEEWLARYYEYVAALQKGLQSIKSTASKTQDIVGPQFEASFDITTSVEDNIERMICSHIPLTDPAFLLFLTEQEGGIQEKFQQIRQGHLYKFAYFRWKALSVEEQASWHKRASTLPVYSKTCN